jgi:hypothetical protein
MGDNLRHGIAEAQDRMNAKFPKSLNKALSLLAEDLEPSEVVLRVAVGLLHTSAFQQSGILALTGQRILFIHAGLVQSQQVSVPLDTVTGAAVFKGPVYSTVKTTGPQSNVIVGRMNKADAEAFASELRSLLSYRTHGSTETPSPVAIDIPEQLERLAALRDRGVLTELEFASQKTKLLGG